MEQQGLAAWMVTVPSTLPGTMHHTGLEIEEPWQQELVLRLADLVVGQRREVKHG